MREYKILPENNMPRRWFKDDRLDLVVWMKPEEGLHGFQLTYFHETHTIGGKILDQRVITYFNGETLKHQFVPEETQAQPVPKTLVPLKDPIPKKDLVSDLRNRTLPPEILDPILKTLG